MRRTHAFVYEVCTADSIVSLLYCFSACVEKGSVCRYNVRLFFLFAHVRIYVPRVYAYNRPLLMYIYNTSGLLYNRVSGMQTFALTHLAVVKLWYIR